MSNYKFGIDVSEWQGEINWKRVADYGVSFAIVRLGYGTKGVDKFGVANIRGCVDNSIPYGVYWFSYANSAKTASDEAKKCLALLDGDVPPLGVWYDFEAASISNGDKIARINWGYYAKSFCDVIAGAGLKCGIYTNYDFYRSAVTLPRAPLWLAHWGAKEPTYADWDIWQSGKDVIPGIMTAVDTNYCKEGVLQLEKMYKTFDSLPDWAKPDIKKFMDARALVGDDAGNINLTESTVKSLCVLSRYLSKCKNLG